jgi:hypothetical protein
MLRDKNPAQGVVSLGKILKRIRDKRAHGFKARGASRDAAILGAARPLLLRLCEFSMDVIQPNTKPAG